MADLRGDQRTGQRAVDVPHDDDPRGPVLHQHRLEPFHDPRGLDRMRRRPDLEQHVRRRRIEIREQLRRHVEVVMLSGVDEQPREASSLELVKDRHDLHEIRACAGDHDDRTLRG